MQKKRKNSHDFSILSSRKSIFINLINQNPGIRYRELKNLTGLSNGVVSYHLHQLESKGLVKSVKTPRVSCFYPLSLSEFSQIIFRRSRQITPKRILLALIQTFKFGCRSFRKFLQFCMKNSDRLNVVAWSIPSS